MDLRRHLGLHPSIDGVTLGHTDGGSALFDNAQLERLVQLLEGFERCPQLPQQEWYSIKQVAALTGLSRRHVMRAIKQGRLLCSNVGTDKRATYRISHDDIESWMRTCQLRVGVSRAGQ